MADETKNSQSALEQLKALQKNDSISSLDISEPALKGFDASSVFKIDNQPQETKHKIFGKRSARHATVTIQESVFDNDDVQVEDIYVSNKFKPETVKPEKKEEASAPKILSQEPIELKEEAVEPEIQEEAVDQTIQMSPVPETAEEVKEEPVEEIQKEVTEDVVEEPVEEVTEEVVEETSEEPEVEEEVDENEIETSLEDQNHYDEEELYVDKHKFLLSQYDKEEEYLEEQSQEGYHYVRNVGKRYYFVKEEPRDYYYSICFFAVEPSAYEWRKWEADGWKLVSRVPAKRKQDAGWFVFRNEYGQDELKKEIPNEAEKFKFFKKYSNSCRSTMFLFFICMAVCACAAFLQYMFNGFIAVMIGCGVLFLMSFIFFCLYGRMLASSSKKVRILKARLRVRERQESFNQEGELDLIKSEEELDTEWNSLDNEELELDEEIEEEEEDEEVEEEKPKKRRFGRRK